MVDNMATFDAITFEQYIMDSLPQINRDNTVTISKYYMKTFQNLQNQPQLYVSELCKLFQRETLGYLPISFAGRSTTYGRLAHQMTQTNMFHYYPGAYQVLDFTILEIVALNWSFTNAPKLINFINKKDIKRIRYNLQVMADWCGDHRDYYGFIPRLRRLSVDLGMLENKLEYLTNYYDYTE